MAWKVIPKLSRRWLDMTLVLSVGYLLMLYDNARGHLHTGVVRAIQQLLGEKGGGRSKEYKEGNQRQR